MHVMYACSDICMMELMVMTRCHSHCTCYSWYKDSIGVHLFISQMVNRL